MSDQNQPPAQPGEVREGVSIQPAMHATPGPLTINVTSNQQPSGEKIVILHIEHMTGSTFAFLTPEFAKNVGENLIEQASGIQIARADSRIIRG